MLPLFIVSNKKAFKKVHFIVKSTKLIDVLHFSSLNKSSYTNRMDKLMIIGGQLSTKWAIYKSKTVKMV